MSYIWYGIKLPGREADQLYQTLCYASLPSIKIYADYADIHTIDDLKVEFSDDMLVDRPRLSRRFNGWPCHFDVNKETGVFYRDQQDCVVWSLGDDLAVYADDGKCVANTLPEFLSRLKIEGDIFTKTMAYYGRSYDPLTADEQDYVDHYKTYSPTRLNNST
jgi:hypothetical protein